METQKTAGCCGNCSKCSSRQDEPSTDISRRNFLARSTFVLGGLIGTVLSWNIGRYFISPIWGVGKENWVKVVSLDSVPLDSPILTNYVERVMDGWMPTQATKNVWLIRNANGVVAFNPQCTHLGCGYNWDQTKRHFLCPCHDGVFSANGDVVSGPPERPLDRYPVKIEGGMVVILSGAKEEKKL